MQLGDITDDGTPDLLLWLYFYGGGEDVLRTITAIDGATGAVLFTER